MSDITGRNESKGAPHVPSRLRRAIPLLIAAAALTWLGFSHAATPREASAEQLQQMLRRFPDADLNKDGQLTVDEFRQYRLKTQSGGKAKAASRPSAATRKGPSAPSAATLSVPAASAPVVGKVEIQIASDKPVPVNPRVYGIICEEMFVKDLVDEPEYIEALTDLQFKAFEFPGGSVSYYHHPEGTGGFNVRSEEVAKSKQGEQSRFMDRSPGPDHLEQYIQFVKASGGSALFVANILNGTVDELDEYLTRLQAAQVPIACVILGVEMHLGQPGEFGLDWYVERIKPYFPMLQSKYPDVPIVLHSTPVGRVGERASASFHEWNQRLAQLPGIAGFSQYGWPEFGGQPRLNSLSAAASAKTPAEIFAQYDEFTQDFPRTQIPAYQKDWGDDKKMYMLQWGTHADRNTPVQGLHIANFYFFLAQYNAAHDNYFAAATSALNLAQPVSNDRPGHEGIVYKEKVSLLAPYLYTKPFRHLFSGDTSLLAASVQGAEGLVDGKKLPADSRVEVESVWANPDAGGQAARGGEAPAKTFAGERDLGALVLEPLSLTLLIIAK
ncbi:MAG: hypothetical protein NTW86_04535 [Candidatus Sumerlaeota bacterium]|nr:hypothetical protein [Candidatus Sumerlaeota bacterium]